MPFRRELSEPLDPDRFGDFHQDRAQMRESLPRGGGDETCGLCGKGVEARADCGACGDSEEMAA